MKMENIEEIAKKIGLKSEDIERYGDYKAKIKDEFIKSRAQGKDGKLVLVTAITPTKAGEGKTTTSIALADGLAKIGKKAILCLREPSMGPVFGLKGGATGGGKATIEPSEDINLHFTGDMHALTSSINLVSAVIDNHIYQGNELNIDQNKILWKRALDVNDRELREVQIGLGGPKNGIIRLDHFEITVASELMAILCISTSKDDFSMRLDRVIIALDKNGEPVYFEQLGINGAIMKIMRDALKPNLVQTAEHNPVFVHGGPFANIAHGCSSLIATKLALKLSPIVLTEAGFAADLGAEKFFDIKCRIGGLNPSGAVLVATIRALKMHGGEAYENLKEENLPALEEGLKNLEQHYENLRKFNVPVVIAINHFASDSPAEIELLEDRCKKRGYMYAFLDGYLNGGEGSIDLANKVIEMLETKNSDYHPLYELKDSIETKIEKIAKGIYRASEVIYTDQAKSDIEMIKKLGKEDLVVCMAKTPLSFSDDPKLLNTPRNFSITVRGVKLSNGAGFLVVYCGNVLTMPGLPKHPVALDM
jgi:formate--tetrahydrofolate ligase